VMAKNLFPPNINSSFLTLKPWRISPWDQTLGHQSHENTISKPSNELVHENLSSLDVLDHCVQNLTPLKLNLFLNYSTYFPKLVVPLFSPICFVVLSKVLLSHQIMSVLTLSFELSI
jgi:hypothetical protein